MYDKAFHLAFRYFTHREKNRNHESFFRRCTLHIYGIIEFPQHCQQIFIASKLFSGSISSKITDNNRFVLRLWHSCLKIFIFLQCHCSSSTRQWEYRSTPCKVQVNEHIFAISLIKTYCVPLSTYALVSVCCCIFFLFCSSFLSLQYSYMHSKILFDSISKRQ